MDILYYTPAQKQIWELQELYPALGICNIAGRMKLEKKYTSDLLCRALQLLVKDIPVLRICIDESHRPYLADFRIKLERWSGDSVPDREELSEWLRTTMWVEHQPLCGFMYCDVGTELELYIKVHHLQFDSYGLVLGARRFLEILKCVDEGREWKEEPDYRFIERMCAECDVSEKGITWLNRKLTEANLESEMRSKRRYGQVISGRKRYHLPERIFCKMKESEGGSRCSLETMLASAMAVYFSKISGKESFVFGRTLINRRKEDMNLPGMMANTLPVFLYPAAEKGFFQLCMEAKSYFYEMMRYSDLDMTAFQRKTGINGALYDAMLTFRRQKHIPFLEGMEQQEIFNPYLELPLRIYADELDQELRLDFQYQTGCYHEQEVDALYRRLLFVLEQGLDGRNISDISVMSPEDQRLWEAVNRTDEPLVHDLIPEKIAAWAQKDGSRIAFRYHDTAVTYGQLEQQASKLGRFLVSKGIRAGDIVGVCLGRPEKIPAVFQGIWKSGAAFLPVSIKESKERINEIRKNCAFFIDDETIVQDHSFDVSEFPAIRPEMTAYCMYTSGSTGKAKAAVISHHSLACRLEWMESRYHCSESVLQKAACTFDVSMWEYFLPLSEGGCLYLTSEEEKRDPAALLALLAENKIRTVHFVPSLMAVWLKYVREYRVQLPKLRDVFSSGESLTPGLVQEFYSCFPDTRLHNLYGPAECTIDVTCYDCKKGDLSIPIGRPVSGTKIQILNSLRQCQPPGIEGELSVKGVLVGEGYLGQSSDKFRRDENGEKVYDTGDRAVLGFDGQIYYLGRNDSQCKINGMRVDLAQIESVINEYPDVLRTAVIYTQKQIAGFYMAEHELEGLSPYLKQALPYYCIPQRLVFCRNIPLNSNGKTDRNYLEGLLTAPQIVGPESREEELIYELVKEKLDKDISVEENLFLAGVDSLMVMELVIELEKKGFRYTPEDFYENLTIRKLAAGGAKGYQWLVKKGQRVMVLAFPYAAGNAEDYKSLADKLGRRGVDFCVARAADRVPEVTDYDSVILLGYCTGCAEAMHAAERFSAGGRRPDGMILCAAVPPSKWMARKGSPWENMGDEQIGRILDYLHGTAMDWNRESISRFRKDTNRFFRYFARNHKKISADTVLFFGERDALTFPASIRWKHWKRFLDGKVICRILRKKGHFFLKSGSRQIADAVICLLNHRTEDVSRRK